MYSSTDKATYWAAVINANSLFVPNKLNDMAVAETKKTPRWMWDSVSLFFSTDRFVLNDSAVDNIRNMADAYGKRVRRNAVLLYVASRNFVFISFVTSAIFDAMAFCGLWMLLSMKGVEKED